MPRHTARVATPLGLAPVPGYDLVGPLLALLNFSEAALATAAPAQLQQYQSASIPARAATCPLDLRSNVSLKPAQC